MLPGNGQVQAAQSFLPPVVGVPPDSIVMGEKSGSNPTRSPGIQQESQPKCQDVETPVRRSVRDVHRNSLETSKSSTVNSLRELTLSLEWFF